MNSKNWKTIVKGLKELGASEIKLQFSDGSNLDITLNEALPKKLVSVPIESRKNNKEEFDEEDLYYST